MNTGQATNRTGKNANSSRVYDIPVLFQARAETEEQAAQLVSEVLGDADVLSRDWLEDEDMGFDREIESWHMPNHQFADGSDIPVHVIVVQLEPEYSERVALVKRIEEMLQ